MLERRFFDHHRPGLGFGGRGPGGPGPGPGLGFGALRGDVLHSEATVKTPDGIKVVGSQSGKITDVGGAAVTVRSSDGFTRTYTVDKDTRIALNGTDGALTSLKSGDTVHVMGSKSGSTWHARGIFDGDPPMPLGIPKHPS
jgi:hypothetical protein